MTPWRTAPPTRVEVLVCGWPRHGDDAAACVALEYLAPTLGSDVRTRRVGQLALDDLLAVVPGAGVVVVDTAIGLAPGWTVEFAINGLSGRASGIHPRASFALSTPETLEVVSIIRDAPMVGMVVVIGGLDFGLGEPLSWPVLGGMDAFVLAIADAVDRVRGQTLVGDASRIGPGRAEWPTGNGPDATSPTGPPERR